MAWDRDDRRDWRQGPAAEREGRYGREQARYGDEDRYGGDRREDRGFFERARDEVASWFGDEDEDRGRMRERGEDRDRDDWSRGARVEGRWSRRGGREDDGWLSAGRGRRRHDESDDWSSGRENYGGRFEGGLAGPGYGRSGESWRTEDYGRSGREDRRDYEHDTQRLRDAYSQTSFAGSTAASNRDDMHYQEWRRRQLEDLDRDYNEYRSECQSRFESDFGSWRERRLSKRQMLGQIREHMEVVGSDDQHVGTVDRVAGDRVILTRSDPESGGVHHSLSCTEVDRVEGDRVILEVSADQARQRWRDESRGRALFEREDQGDAGPHFLERSFSGTYR